MHACICTPMHLLRRTPRACVCLRQTKQQQPTTRTQLALEVFLPRHIRREGNFASRGGELDAVLDLFEAFFLRDIKGVAGFHFRFAILSHSHSLTPILTHPRSHTCTHGAGRSRARVCQRIQASWPTRTPSSSCSACWPLSPSRTWPKPRPPPRTATRPTAKQTG
jgi:hypothetical protein